MTRHFTPRRFLTTLLFAFWCGGTLLAQRAFSYPVMQNYPTKIAIVYGEPVAPPILDREGAGFCMIAKKAEFYKQPSPRLGFKPTAFDAGSVFGNEFNITNPLYNDAKYGDYPPSRFPTNVATKGGSFVAYVNAFLDNTSLQFLPVEVSSFASNTLVSDKMTVPFDLSSNTHPLTDNNGDFLHSIPLAPACDKYGCPFPGFKILPNFDPNDPTNQYHNPLVKQMYPEADDSLDKLHSTASRFRAIFNVKPGEEGQTFVFAMYANDAGALTFFDKAGKSYPVISVASNRCEACVLSGASCRSPNPPNRPGGDVGGDDPGPQICARPAMNVEGWCTQCERGPTGERWRVTGQITFKQPGLYPIEILHAQFAGSAALEVSMKILPPGEVPATVHESWGFPALPGQTSDTSYNKSMSRPFTEQGFTLLQPGRLYPSLTSFEQMCASGQCVRETGAGCKKGEFCNEAAICEPCDASGHCGELCQPCVEPGKLICGRTSPSEFSCVPCNVNADCPGRQNCASDNQCHCQNTFDCPRGQMCQNNTCVTTKVSEACANTPGECCQNGTSGPNCARANVDEICPGNSGQCCPEGTRCKPPTTDPSGQNQPLGCYQCNSYLDCPGQTCDLINHICVDKVATCNTPDQCGSSCLPCPKERPLCAYGKACVECITDNDCPTASACVGGECSPCNSDRKCGLGCHECPFATPICDARAGAEKATCVACYQDSHCGDNTKCDPNTNTCQTKPGCKMTCPDPLLCDGDGCIQCVSDVQCPASCGGRGHCFLDTHKCTSGCQVDSDCLGNQCCNQLSKLCEPGLCKQQTLCGGSGCLGLLNCEATPTNRSMFGETPLQRKLALGTSALLILIAFSLLRWRFR